MIMLNFKTAPCTQVRGTYATLPPFTWFFGFSSLRHFARALCEHGKFHSTYLLVTSKLPSPSSCLRRSVRCIKPTMQRMSSSKESATLPHRRTCNDMCHVPLTTGARRHFVKWPPTKASTAAAPSSSSDFGSHWHVERAVLTYIVCLGETKRAAAATLVGQVVNSSVGTSLTRANWCWDKVFFTQQPE